MVRNILASKRASHGVKYKFGVRVPRNIDKAYNLDKLNINILWYDDIFKEVCLLRDDFGCFHVAKENDISDQHQKIPLL